MRFSERRPNSWRLNQSSWSFSDAAVSLSAETVLCSAA